MRKLLLLGMLVGFVVGNGLAATIPYSIPNTQDVNNSPQAIVIPYAVNSGLINTPTAGQYLSYVPGVTLVQGVSGGTPITTWALPIGGQVDRRGVIAAPTSDFETRSIDEMAYLQANENSTRNMLNDEQAAAPNGGFELR